jgi:DNA-binding response OmpR family regulator
VKKLDRVLVIGKDGPITSDAVRCLTSAGFEVVRARHTDRIAAHWDDEHASVVVVVASESHQENTDICRRIRARAKAPLVMVGRGADEQEIVATLDAGADDYIIWPSRPRLLAARVDALLRRVKRTTAEQSAARFGEVTLDFVRREVSVRGRRSALTPSEFRLLSCLVKNAGKVVPSRILVRAVQGYDCSETEAQETIKVYVRRLRHKIEPDPREPSYVLNVRGFGYVFETRPKRPLPIKTSRNRLIDEPRRAAG